MDALSSSWSSSRAVVPPTTVARARGNLESAVSATTRAPGVAQAHAAGGQGQNSQSGAVHRLGPRPHNQTLAMLVYQDNAAPALMAARQIDTFA